jgi:hypothetical protein
MKLEKGRVYRLKGGIAGLGRVADEGGWLWVCEETKMGEGPRFRSVATGVTMGLMSPETWLEEAEDEGR